MTLLDWLKFFQMANFTHFRRQASNFFSHDCIRWSWLFKILNSWKKIKESFNQKSNFMSFSKNSVQSIGCLLNSAYLISRKIWVTEKLCRLNLLSWYDLPLTRSSGSGGSAEGDKVGGGELLSNFLNSGFSSRLLLEIFPFFLELSCDFDDSGKKIYFD